MTGDDAVKEAERDHNHSLKAKILRRGGNFLILDEPTNDLGSERCMLEETIMAFKGARGQSRQRLLP